MRVVRETFRAVENRDMQKLIELYLHGARWW
jgi:hypothetical protein